VLGRALPLDFSGPMPPPDWLVSGLVERGTITMLSADSGVGKSFISASMAVAIIQGKPWLGRKTYGQRVMIVDEENFARIVHSRLRSLGMTNADRAQMRYFLRVGVQLGTSDWFERLREEMDVFHPDMLIIDTAAAATSIEMNDNNAVARLYGTALRPLADEAAVLLLHHERKPQAGGKRDAGHAMMGARQWAGQADAHLALERLGEVVEESVPGGFRRRYPLRLEMPKSREGQSGAERVVIVSEHNLGETQPRWTRVEREESH
jgi:RecA-family ATPase